uniref:Secreted protein n=1 Tax=Angiostrongylus cantonensis TaxID=6313 RepID=A0A0K0D5G3_ANGCA
MSCLIFYTLGIDLALFIVIACTQFQNSACSSEHSSCVYSTSKSSTSNDDIETAGAQQQDVGPAEAQPLARSPTSPSDGGGGVGVVATHSDRATMLRRCCAALLLLVSLLSRTDADERAEVDIRVSGACSPGKPQLIHSVAREFSPTAISFRFVHRFYIFLCFSLIFDFYSFGDIFVRRRHLLGQISPKLTNFLLYDVLRSLLACGKRKHPFDKLRLKSNGERCCRTITFVKLAVLVTR